MSVQLLFSRERGPQRGRHEPRLVGVRSTNSSVADQRSPSFEGGARDSVEVTLRAVQRVRRLLRDSRVQRCRNLPRERDFHPITRYGTARPRCEWGEAPRGEVALQLYLAQRASRRNTFHGARRRRRRRRRRVLRRGGVALCEDDDDQEQPEDARGDARKPACSARGGHGRERSRQRRERKCASSREPRKLRRRNLRGSSEWDSLLTFFFKYV